MGKNFKDRDDDRRLGPRYDINTAPLGRFRFKAKDGLANLDRQERKEYAAAVESAVLASQRSKLSRVTIEPRSMATSGTFHNTGEAIHRAVLAQQRARLLAAPSQERRARTPKQWQEMYEAAMKEKNGVA